MYNSEKSFLEIKNAFENKKIIEVSHGIGESCIAKFLFDDGSAIQIHGNDLGYWTNKVKGKNGYKDLDTLIQDIEDYCYNNENVYKLYSAAIESGKYTSIYKIDDKVYFECLDGKIFNIDHNNLTLYEKRVVDHPIGIKILEIAIDTKYFGWLLFTKNNDSQNWDNPPPVCPDELILTKEDGKLSNLFNK